MEIVSDGDGGKLFVEIRTKFLIKDVARRGFRVFPENMKQSSYFYDSNVSEKWFSIAEINEHTASTLLCFTSLSLTLPEIKHTKNFFWWRQKHVVFLLIFKIDGFI